MATIRTSIQLNDNMSQAFNAINVAMQSTINSFEHLNHASGDAIDVSSIEIARRELARAESAFNAIERQIEEANNSQKKFNGHIREGTSAADGLFDKIIGIAATYLSLKAVGNLLTTADNIANTSARLEIMNDGLQTTIELQDKILASANRTYSSFDETANMVSKLGILARDAFSSNDEIIAFAEILNKHFVISGTSAEGTQAAMLQLTQAMAAGALRGEELNSVFEQAPTLIQNIADYLKVSNGEIKEMAAKGQITADVVKRAMFAMADETNARFQSMPNTFQDVWNLTMNNIGSIFGDFFSKLTSISDSEKFKSALTEIISHLEILATVATFAVDILITGSNFIYDNWALVGPIILGIVGVFTTFVSALMLMRTWLLVVTMATWAWNTALAANPVVWIIAAIIALIAIIYLVIGVINQFAGTSINATGAIAGAFAVLGAFIWNTVVGVINAVIQFLWTGLVEPWISIIEWVLNVFNGGFNSFGDAVANLLGQIISWFLSLGKVVTKIIDAIFDTNWTAGLSSLQDSVIEWGKNEEAITLERNAPTINSRIEYGKSWDAGNDWGANLFNNDTKLNKSLDNELNMKGILDSLQNVSDSGDKTAGNTKKLADSATLLTDELKYLRDLAERESINRYTTAEIKVDMKNENHINSKMDIDGVIDRFGEKVEETIEILAEGDDMDV